MLRSLLTLLLGASSLLVFAQDTKFQGIRLPVEDPLLTATFESYQIYEIDANEIDQFVQKEGNLARFQLDLAEDYSWDILLYPNDMRADNYFITVQNGDQKEIIPKKNKVTTFQGYLQAPGAEDDMLAFTINDDFLYGFIKEDGKEYYIEPLNYFLPNQANNLFIVYTTEDVKETPGHKCGAIGNGRK